MDDVRGWYGVLLGHRRDFVRRFAAESLGLLFRRLEEDAMLRQMGALIKVTSSFEDLSSVDNIRDGVSRLLAELCRGSRGSLHSSTKAVLAHGILASRPKKPEGGSASDAGRVSSNRLALVSHAVSVLLAHMNKGSSRTGESVNLIWEALRGECEACTKRILKAEPGYAAELSAHLGRVCNMVTQCVTSRSHHMTGQEQSHLWKVLKAVAAAPVLDQAGVSMGMFESVCGVFQAGWPLLGSFQTELLLRDSFPSTSSSSGAVDQAGSDDDDDDDDAAHEQELLAATARRAKTLESVTATSRTELKHTKLIDRLFEALLTPHGPLEGSLLVAGKMLCQCAGVTARAIPSAAVGRVVMDRLRAALSTVIGQLPVRDSVGILLMFVAAVPASGPSKEWILGSKDGLVLSKRDHESLVSQLIECVGSDATDRKLLWGAVHSLGALFMDSAKRQTVLRECLPRSRKAVRAESLLESLESEDTVDRDLSTLSAVSTAMLDRLHVLGALLTELARRPLADDLPCVLECASIGASLSARAAAWRFSGMFAAGALHSLRQLHAAGLCVLDGAARWLEIAGPFSSSAPLEQMLPALSSTDRSTRLCALRCLVSFEQPSHLSAAAAWEQQQQFQSNPSSAPSTTGDESTHAGEPCRVLPLLLEAESLEITLLTERHRITRLETVGRLLASGTVPASITTAACACMAGTVAIKFLPASKAALSILAQQLRLSPKLVWPILNASLRLAAISRSSPLPETPPGPGTLDLLSTAFHEVRLHGPWEGRSGDGVAFAAGTRIAGGAYVDSAGAFQTVREGETPHDVRARLVVDAAAAQQTIRVDSAGHADGETFHRLLLSLFEQVPDALQKENEVIVALFLSFVVNDYFGGHRRSDPDASLVSRNVRACSLFTKLHESTASDVLRLLVEGNPGSQRVDLGNRASSGRLRSFLAVLSKLPRLSSVVAPDAVRDVVVRLLMRPDASQEAMKCVLAFRAAYTKPYRQVLSDLASPKQFLRAMTQFDVSMTGSELMLSSGEEQVHLHIATSSDSKSSSSSAAAVKEGSEPRAILPDHRAGLIPIIVRTLMGQVLGRPGKGRGGVRASHAARRNTILSYLSRLMPDELELVVQLSIRHFVSPEHLELLPAHDGVRGVFKEQVWRPPQTESSTGFDTLVSIVSERLEHVSASVALGFLGLTSDLFRHVGHSISPLRHRILSIVVALLRATSKDAAAAPEEEVIDDGVVEEEAPDKEEEEEEEEEEAHRSMSIAPISARAKSIRSLALLRMKDASVTLSDLPLHAELGLALSAVASQLIHLPQACLSASSPPALLQLLHAMASSAPQSTLFRSVPHALPAFFLCLSQGLEARAVEEGSVSVVMGSGAAPPIVALTLSALSSLVSQDIYRLQLGGVPFTGQASSALLTNNLPIISKPDQDDDPLPRILVTASSLSEESVVLSMLPVLLDHLATRLAAKSRAPLSAIDVSHRPAHSDYIRTVPTCFGHIAPELAATASAAPSSTTAELLLLATIGELLSHKSLASPLLGASELVTSTRDGTTVPPFKGVVSTGSVDVPSLASACLALLSQGLYAASVARKRKTLAVEDPTFDVDTSMDPSDDPRAMTIAVINELVRVSNRPARAVEAIAGLLGPGPLRLCSTGVRSMAVTSVVTATESHGASSVSRHAASLLSDLNAPPSASSSVADKWNYLAVGQACEELARPETLASLLSDAPSGHVTAWQVLPCLVAQVAFLCVDEDMATRAAGSRALTAITAALADKLEHLTATDTLASVRSPFDESHAATANQEISLLVHWVIPYLRRGIMGANSTYRRPFVVSLGLLASCNVQRLSLEIRGRLPASFDMLDVSRIGVVRGIPVSFLVGAPTVFYSDLSRLGDDMVAQRQGATHQSTDDGEHASSSDEEVDDDAPMDTPAAAAFASSRADERRARHETREAKSMARPRAVRVLTALVDVRFERRVRAMRKLCRSIEQTLSDGHTLSARTVHQVLIPLVMHSLHDQSRAMGSSRHTLEPGGFYYEAASTVGQCSRILPWRQWVGILRSLLVQVSRSSTVHGEDTLVQAVCRVIDGFHFDIRTVVGAESAAPVAEGEEEEEDVTDAAVTDAVASDHRMMRSLVAEAATSTDNDDAAQQLTLESMLTGGSHHHSIPLEHLPFQLIGVPVVDLPSGTLVKTVSATGVAVMRALTDRIATSRHVDPSAITASHINQASGDRKHIRGVLVQRLLPALRGLLRRGAVDMAQNEDDKAVRYKGTRGSGSMSSNKQSVGALRAPMAVALTKLINRLPRDISRQEVPRLLLRVCATLTSRAQNVRDKTRHALAQVAAELGPLGLRPVLMHLKSALREGFRIHVLGHAVATVMEAMQPVLTMSKPLVEDYQASRDSATIEDLVDAEDALSLKRAEEFVLAPESKDEGFRDCVPAGLLQGGVTALNASQPALSQTLRGRTFETIPERDGHLLRLEPGPRALTDVLDGLMQLSLEDAIGQAFQARKAREEGERVAADANEVRACRAGDVIAVVCRCIPFLPHPAIHAVVAPMIAAIVDNSMDPAHIRVITALMQRAWTALLRNPSVLGSRLAVYSFTVVRDNMETPGVMRRDVMEMLAASNAKASVRERNRGKGNTESIFDGPTALAGDSTEVEPAEEEEERIAPVESGLRSLVSAATMAQTKEGSDARRFRRGKVQSWKVKDSISTQLAAGASTRVSAGRLPSHVLSSVAASRAADAHRTAFPEDTYRILPEPRYTGTGRLVYDIEGKSADAVVAGTGGGSSAGGNEMIDFALSLLLGGMRKGVIRGRDDDATLAVLSKTVPLMVRCITLLRAETAVALALRCLSSMAPLPLPSLREHSKVLLRTMLMMLTSVTGASASVAGASRVGEGNTTLDHAGERTAVGAATVRAMTSILLHVHEARPNLEQLKAIITIVRPDLSSPVRQASSLALLRAVVTRRQVVPELYDAMQDVARIMVRSLKESCRSRCTHIFLDFLMHFPLTDKRVTGFVQFFLRNLEYSEPRGRQAVIDVLTAIVSKFPLGVLESQANVLFLTLLTRLVGETDARCRASIGALVQKLFERLEPNASSRLLQMLCQWLGPTQKASIQQAATHTVALLAQSSPSLLSIKPSVHSDSSSSPGTAPVAFSQPMVLGSLRVLEECIAQVRKYEDILTEELTRSDERTPKRVRPSADADTDHVMELLSSGGVDVTASGEATDIDPENVWEGASEGEEDEDWTQRASERADAIFKGAIPDDDLAEEEEEEEEEGEPSVRRGKNWEEDAEGWITAGPGGVDPEQVFAERDAMMGFVQPVSSATTATPEEEEDGDEEETSGLVGLRVGGGVAGGGGEVLGLGDAEKRLSKEERTLLRQRREALKARVHSVSRVHARRTELLKSLRWRLAYYACLSLERLATNLPAAIEGPISEGLVDASVLIRTISQLSSYPHHWVRVASLRTIATLIKRAHSTGSKRLLDDAADPTHATGGPLRKAFLVLEDVAPLVKRLCGVVASPSASSEAIDAALQSLKILTPLAHVLTPASDRASVHPSLLAAFERDLHALSTGSTAGLSDHTASGPLDDTDNGSNDVCMHAVRRVGWACVHGPLFARLHGLSFIDTLTASLEPKATLSYLPVIARTLFRIGDEHQGVPPLPRIHGQSAVGAAEASAELTRRLPHIRDDASKLGEALQDRIGPSAFLTAYNAERDSRLAIKQARRQDRALEKVADPAKAQARREARNRAGKRHAKTKIELLRANSGRVRAAPGSASSKDSRTAQVITQLAGGRSKRDRDGPEAPASAKRAKIRRDKRSK
jgi:hypothetical protein